MSAADMHELARAIILTLDAEKSGAWCWHAARRLVEMLARGIEGADGHAVRARLRSPSIITWQGPARCIASIASGQHAVKAALARVLTRDGRSVAVLVTLCAYLDGTGADVACAAPCDPDALLRLGIIAQDEHRAMREALKQSAPSQAPREV